MTASTKFGLAMAIAVALIASRVDAADPEAASIYRAGQTAYARGDFAAAAAAFEQAATLSPNPEAWFYAGEAWTRAGDKARAAQAMATALALGGLDDEKRATANEQLATLSVDLGIVKVRGPRELRVSVAHVRRAAPPVDVYVPPGDHAVQIVEGPGKGSKLARVTAGATVTITFDAPRPRPTPIKRAKPKPQRGNTIMQAFGWTALGLGVTSGVAAIVLGVKGLDARDEWEADLRNRDLKARAETLRLWTNVAWGGAAVFSVTGVVLVVVEATSRETDSGSSAAAFGIGPFGGWLSASW